jgi:hypothetical protein
MVEAEMFYYKRMGRRSFWHEWLSSLYVYYVLKAVIQQQQR